MILTKTNNEEFIIGAEKEMTFSIDTEGDLVFSILRDKMYSDKIGAVAREIASNSRDANREAGRGDVPITIEVVKPNKFASIGHQSIVFSDNGIGITPDRMADVFIKYGSSTKNGSNNQTGGFGLGAKTPFAYSDTFTVITVCNWKKPIIKKEKIQFIIGTEEYNEILESGEEVEVLEFSNDLITINREMEVIKGHEPERTYKFMYNAIIDESNKGKMILLESEPSDEPTGTKIVVPIKTDVDRLLFEQKVINATKYWVDGVNYVGFWEKKPEIDKIYEEENFLVVKKRDSSQKGYGLLIDGIGYPLDKSQVSIKDSGLGSQYDILIKFKTGEVTISANRESVQYDENTIKVIKERYEFIQNKILDLTNDYVSKLKSYKEACKFYFYLSSSKLSQREKIKDEYLRMLVEAFNPNKEYHIDTILSEKRKELQDMEFDGKKVKGSFELKHHSWMYVTKPIYRGEKTKYSPMVNLNITEKLLDTPIYYSDARRNVRRNETIWETDKVFSLLVPRNNVNVTDKERLDEINDIMTEFDLDFKMYGDVELKKPEAKNYVSSYQKTDTVTICCRKFSNGHFTNYNIEVDRKTKLLKNKSADNFVYDTVSYLSGFTYASSIRKKADFVKKYGNKTVIIINEASERNWIQHTGMKKFEEEFQILDDKFKRKWVEDSKNEIIKDIFSDVFPYPMHKLLPIKDELYPILPKSIQKVFDIIDEKDDGDDFMRQDVVFNSKGLKDKLIRILDDEHPMLLPYIEHEFGWSRKDNNIDKKRKIINEYLNRKK